MNVPECYVCWIRTDGRPNPATRFVRVKNGEVRPICDVCLEGRMEAEDLPFEDGIDEWTVLEVMRK